MSRIAIVTDSNSGITQAEARQLGIYVMPMPFFVNEKLYYEEVDLSLEQFYELLAQDVNVSTSQPSPADVMDLWNKLNESQQNALQEAANKLEDDRWAAAPVETKTYEQKLVDYGIEMIEFTDDELKAFYDKCQETVWPELTELYGEEAVNLVASLKG